MENINKTHTPIKQWAEDDRPREKMIQQGAAALSKAELLAILINHGTRSRSAIELARDLLESCGGNINRLSKMSVAEIQRIKGIGPAKAITIKAALELGIRKETDRINIKKAVIRSSKQAADYLQQILMDSPMECLVAIFMNAGNRVLDRATISQGGLTATVVDIRLIAKRALELGATSVLISHNHPSGNLVPSQADKAITEKIKRGLKELDIELTDHIIVSEEGFYSFSDAGIL
jgi:DNA repair protein RadC